MEKHTWETKCLEITSFLNSSWAQGFRSGWLDASLGHDLQTGRCSPWADYAEGYKRGQAEQQAGKEGVTP